jgi:hypothetical protein
VFPRLQSVGQACASLHCAFSCYCYTYTVEGFGTFLFARSKFHTRMLSLPAVMMVNSSCRQNLTVWHASDAAGDLRERFEIDD